MGKYTDIAARVRRQQDAENVIDGHEVQAILWHTEKMVIFRDPEGRLWRRVHSWGLTWPVTVGKTQR
jgi:hypothetical protein